MDVTILSLRKKQPRKTKKKKKKEMGEGVEEEEGVIVEPEISLFEVEQNVSREKCWVIFEGYVLDITSFLNEHPGGAKILLRHAGSVHFIISLLSFFFFFRVLGGVGWGGVGWGGVVLIFCLSLLFSKNFLFIFFS